MRASLALVLTAASDLISFGVAALGANRLAVRLGPTHLLEQFPGFFLPHAIDIAKRDRAGLG